MAITFYNPQINFYVEEVEKVAVFYQSLGFLEVFRTPEEGIPIHVELSLNGFTLGIASMASAREMHLIPADEGAPRVEVVLWTNNVDEAFAQLTASGAQVISKPHNFLSDLRAAWIYDPAGNPVQLVARLNSR